MLTNTFFPSFDMTRRVFFPCAQQGSQVLPQPRFPLGKKPKQGVLVSFAVRSPQGDFAQHGQHPCARVRSQVLAKMLEEKSIGAPAAALVDSSG